MPSKKINSLGRPMMNGDVERTLPNQTVKGFNTNKLWIIGGLALVAYFVMKTDKI